MWKNGRVHAAILLALGAATSFALAAGPKEQTAATRTVIVLRHAEKVENPDPPVLDEDVPLTVAGETRAATLADVLAKAGVTKIYVTPAKRTQRTAKDLVDRLRIKTQPPIIDVSKLVDEILGPANRGQVIVVVGHSTTVPLIVEKLGGGTVTVGDEFDNLFVLTLEDPTTTRMIRATYGEPRKCDPAPLPPIKKK
jgi:phosphohistidine phosphatase SixA